MTPSSEPSLTIDDAAELLGKSYDHVVSLMERGKLHPFWHIPGTYKALKIPLPEPTVWCNQLRIPRQDQL